MYMSDWECVALKLFAVGLDDWGLLEIWVEKVADKTPSCPGLNGFIIYFCYLISKT